MHETLILWFSGKKIAKEVALSPFRCIFAKLMMAYLEKTMKKLLLTIVAVLAAVGAKADGETVAVTSRADFHRIAVLVNSGMDDFRGKTVVLLSDINMENELWLPIGTADHPFQGMFDGQGCSVFNLNVFVDGEDTGDVAGLFGSVGQHGVVKRVRVATGTVCMEEKTDSAAVCYVGGIAGRNAGRITECSNYAEVLGNQVNAVAGGIVGENAATGVVEDCYSRGTLYTTRWKPEEQNDMGGIVGHNHGSINRTFVSATVRRTARYGGIYAKTDRRESVTNSFFYMRMEGKAIPGSIALKGNAVKGQLNVGAGARLWTFFDGDYPQLYCFLHDDLVLADKQDNTAALRGHLGQYCRVTLLGRTFYKDENWNTLTLPFSLHSFQNTPLEDAEVRKLERATVARRVLTLTFGRPVTSIEAGTPYIVKWKEAAHLVNPVFPHVFISTATPTPRSLADGKVKMVGTLSPVKIAEADRDKVLFLGSDDRLSTPPASGQMNSCRAYFLLDGSVKEEARRVSLNYEQAPTFQMYDDEEEEED